MSDLVKRSRRDSRCAGPVLAQNRSHHLPVPCCRGGVQGVHAVFEVKPSSRCSPMVDLTMADSCSDRLAVAEYSMLSIRHVGDDTIRFYHIATVPQSDVRWKRFDYGSSSFVSRTTWCVVVRTTDVGHGWPIRRSCLGPPGVWSYAQSIWGRGAKRPLRGAAASLVGPVPGRGFLQSAEIGDDVLQMRSDVRGMSPFGDVSTPAGGTGSRTGRPVLDFAFLTGAALLLARGRGISSVDQISSAY